ncbi:hydrolethalus syndrome protein 1 isoform X2 [Fundulus heteroclitus]|uniref:hydrolethalus syndrome protein 1 isoform X2 n=1 Tax=Fundulus heteroclitus TaxID=8078 RepID=UPI00165A4B60|nr:hydrolethalus syndrome protein 1 isoform X2 [Fundulus heteroclitus]
MYKMYNDQWDEGSDDEKNSLYSSFWSDGEVADKDEEVEIMRVMDPGVVGEPQGVPPGSSPEEHPQLKGSDDERKTTSSSSGSLAVSPMTSGYGTFRAEEQELDHSLTGFNQHSRDDLSGFRDDEEYPGSPRSFTESDNEPTREPDESESAVWGSEVSRVPAASCWCEDDSTLNRASTADTRPAIGTRLPSEAQHLHSDAGDMLLFHRKGLQDGADENQDGKQETLQHDVERSTEQVTVVGVPDESSSNKDVRFIDSNRDFSWETKEKMSEEREEILAWMKDAASRLEERMAELDLSTSDQKDYEAESEDLTESDAQSSDTDGVNLSAFESYIQRMTQTDQDVRPKPKSFIRPVMCQPTIKKTDPVAKYFQYKQMWEMFQVSGEKDRKALRWEIREKLAYQPLPPKPRRVYVPNTYIVPTEKKRSELRWMIRNDLANGLLPQKFNSHF